ncbi:hydantoinase/oxoprolinase N-terminal domain-containing protein, partial [Actinomadura kijaniata]|uniref:hydantoinase/oxoprolinase N-terminal domain-containing protein n=1 Tax=Actinomadura kijaniata TaxID=46161 RepID=UPI0031DE6B91
MRIGIDVGGTNTDAVLLDGDTVLASVKSPTTPEVTGGVEAAIRAVLTDSGIAPTAVTAVMIGTTHFVNALVEADRLAPTAAVRLGLPAGAALPPMVDWPARLRAAVSPGPSGPAVYLCHGGHEYDGSALSPLDEGELRRAAAAFAARGARSVGGLGGV